MANEVTVRVKAETSDATKAIKTFKSSMTEMRATVENVQFAAETFTKVFTTAIQIGKEGAALDYASKKFDNLSKSIGTVSSSLMTDLKVATKGMVSDSKLVGSAGDLMSLGLAKTHDQVVRLTAVSGALNMDMNQLVLTLANQTTMRFDQLGVSIDGFDARLNKLKASGMNVNDAFTEAFLEQAEAQVKLVGNAADSSGAAFTRMETALGNLSDEGKRRLAPFLADAAESTYNLLTWTDRLNAIYQQHGKDLVKTADGYDDYIKKQQEAARAAGMEVVVKNGQIKVYRLSTAGYQEMANTLGVLTPFEYEAARAADATALAVARQTAAHQVNNGALVGATQGFIRYNEATDKSIWYTMELARQAAGIPSAVSLAQQSIENFGKVAGELPQAFQDLASAQANWQAGAGGQVKSELEAAGLKGDKLKEALKAIDDQMGTNFTVEQNFKDNVKALVDQYARTGDVENFKTGLGTMKTKFEELNEKVIDARVRVQELQDALNILTSKSYAVNLGVSISGGGGGGGGGGGSAPGSTGGNTGSTSPNIPNSPLHAGGGGYIVPPGYNDTWPMGGGHYAKSGEAVVAIPANQVTNNHMGGITIIVNGAGNPMATANAIKAKLGGAYQGM